MGVQDAAHGGFGDLQTAVWSHEPKITIRHSAYFRRIGRDWKDSGMDVSVVGGGGLEKRRAHPRRDAIGQVPVALRRPIGPPCFGLAWAGHDT